MWSYWACSTQTGAKIQPLTPAAGSFSRALNRGTTGNKHAFRLFDAERSGYRLKAQTALWNRTLVVCWDDVPVYAGVIMDREYEYDSDLLTVEHGDVRALLARRFTFGSSGYEPAGSTSLLDTTYRGLASRVVQAALVGPAENYDLPIVRPSTSEVGSRSRRWWDYNLPNVDDELDVLQSIAGGPDIDFSPEWSGESQLQWNMRVGTEGVPALGGPTFEFNMTGQQKAFRKLKLREAGSEMANTVYAVGEGSEQKMLVARAAVGRTIPALDRVQSYKQISESADLLAHAQADVAALSSPTRQWSLEYDAAGVVDESGAQLMPSIADLPLGSTLRLYFLDHPWFDDGWTALRLIGFSGSTDSTSISLEVQEVAA